VHSCTYPDTARYHLIQAFWWLVLSELQRGFFWHTQAIASFKKNYVLLLEGFQMHNEINNTYLESKIKRNEQSFSVGKVVLLFMF
jgi:hypothetical protein